MARLRVIITHSNKYRVALTALVGFTLLYGVTNSLQWRNPAVLQPYWVDEAIPLVPETVWIYASLVFFVMLAFALERNPERLNRLLHTQLAVNLLSAVIFVVWPTTVLRPPVAGAEGFSGEGLKLLYLVDAPVNCFPSLHVSMSLLPVFLLWHSRPRLRYVLLIWALGIVLSTMTTKQHQLGDAIGGAMVAVVMYWLFFCRESGARESAVA